MESKCASARVCYLLIAGSYWHCSLSLGGWGTGRSEEPRVPPALAELCSFCGREGSSAAFACMGLVFLWHIGIIYTETRTSHGKGLCVCVCVCARAAALCPMLISLPVASRETVWWVDPAGWWNSSDFFLTCVTSQPLNFVWNKSLAELMVCLKLLPGCQMGLW